MDWKLERACRAKEDVERAGEEFRPTVTWAKDDKLIAVGQVPDFGTRQEKQEAWAQALFFAVMTETDELTLSVDAWMKRVKKEDLETAIPPSEDPNSEQGIMVLVFTKESHKTLFRKYNVGDDGAVLWEEPDEIEGSTAEGWIVEWVGKAFDGTVKPEAMSRVSLAAWMMKNGWLVALDASGDA